MASPKGCSLPGPDLLPSRIARARRRHSCRAPKRLRQSNREVPIENNSDARKSPVATRALARKNRSLQPRHSFGKKSRRVFRPRVASDDRHALPSRPFVPTQTGRRKSAGALRYVKSQCGAVPCGWPACMRRAYRAARLAGPTAHITRPLR